MAQLCQSFQAIRLLSAASRHWKASTSEESLIRWRQIKAQAARGGSWVGMQLKAAQHNMN